MKKQINPTIKAQILRSAFILLSLVAICAIPFALAQSRSRGTTKRSVAKPLGKPLSQLNSVLNPAAGGPHAAPPATGAAQRQLAAPVYAFPPSQLPRPSGVIPCTPGWSAGGPINA